MTSSKGDRNCSNVAIVEDERNRRVAGPAWARAFLDCYKTVGKRPLRSELLKIRGRRFDIWAWGKAKRGRELVVHKEECL